MFFFVVFYCIHDLIQEELPEDPGGYPILFESTKREPIRIHFYLDLLKNESNDIYKCKFVGQKISWDYGNQICSERDLVTAEKSQVVVNTLSNLNRYLTKAINVSRLSDDIMITPFKGTGAPIRNVTADLDVTIMARPFGNTSRLLAAAFYRERSKIDGRPIVGGMYVNFYHIPNVTQDVDSVERFFFITLLHEMAHVLGFSQRAFKHWINPETNQPYGNNVPISTVINPQYPRKKFHLLRTPAIVRHLTQKFGTEYFFGNEKIGLEIEDGGGGSTSGSHPESRVFMDDSMSGLVCSFPRISNLTFSILEDTGWYDVDYSYAEPSPWGDGMSYEGHPIKGFLSEPVPLAFPKEYFCIPPHNHTRCNFDYLKKSFCISYVPEDCANPKTKEEIEFCNNRKFYDPLSWGYRGTVREIDYSIFAIPAHKEHCFDTSRNSYEKTLKGELYSNHSMCLLSTLGKNQSYELTPRCVPMWCNSDGQLAIHVDNQVRYCIKKGTKIYFGGYKGSMICPNPRKVCTMQKYYGFQSGNFTLNSPYQTVIISSIVIYCILIIAIYQVSSILVSHIYRYDDDEVRSSDFNTIDCLEKEEIHFE